MFLLSLVLCGQSHAQVPILPVESMDKDGALQAVQKAYDEKFDVNGGTVTGPMSVSSITVTEQLCFGDATCMTTAPTASTVCVYNSTHTSWGADVTTTATSTGTLITGSSVTLTFAQISRATIRLNFPMRNSGGGNLTKIGVVVDKIPLDGYATSEAVCHSSPAGGAENYRPGCFFDRTTTSTYAIGSHTIEVRGWVDAGTGTYDCAESKCTIQVQEICPQ